MSSLSSSGLKILRDAGLDTSAVAYMSDDLTDVVIMRRVGFPIATANARDEVKRAARYVTRAPGGSGAVREVIELVLQSQNLWRDILDHYECC